MKEVAEPAACVLLLSLLHNATSDSLLLHMLLQVLLKVGERVEDYVLNERNCSHFITARHNAHIASAVLATAILSVCLSVHPSVCHAPVLRQNDCT